MAEETGEYVPRSSLVYVTVWNRIRNEDGTLCCWHPDDTGCPLLGHELVSLYAIEGEQSPTENNMPMLGTTDE